jgi:hypothetical protein
MIPGNYHQIKRNKNSEAVSKNEMPTAIIAGISFFHTPPPQKEEQKFTC